MEEEKYYTVDVIKIDENDFDTKCIGYELFINPNSLFIRDPNNKHLMFIHSRFVIESKINEINNQFIISCKLSKLGYTTNHYKCYLYNIEIYFRNDKDFVEFLTLLPDGFIN